MLCFYVLPINSPACLLCFRVDTTLSRVYLWEHPKRFLSEILVSWGKKFIYLLDGLLKPFIWFHFLCLGYWEEGLHSLHEKIGKLKTDRREDF